MGFGDQHQETQQLSAFTAMTEKGSNYNSRLETPTSKRGGGQNHYITSISTMSIHSDFYSPSAEVQDAVSKNRVIRHIDCCI